MGFGPSTRVRMDHMFGDEVLVWDRFLKREGTRVTGCQYDVRLGTGRRPSLNMSSQDRVMWFELTCKRLDVVCRWLDAIWVVEVKERLCMSALGQVLSYTQLWNSELRSMGQAVPLVVCGQLDDDLVSVFEGSKVRVECV